MKNRLFTLFTLIILSIFLHGITAQETRAYRQPASEKAIPKIVIETFQEQYLDYITAKWFVTHITYWYNDMSSLWYTDWYGQRSVIVYSFEQENYYEVEFMLHPGEFSRAIYNKYGYWYETRTSLKGLTKDIYDSLNDSKYAGWKVSAMKERIETPSWPDPVYRFQVNKGLKSSILRMDAFGNIIQSKSLEE